MPSKHFNDFITLLETDENSAIDFLETNPQLLHETDDNKNNILHYSAPFASIETIKKLLELGVSLVEKNDENVSPLLLLKTHQENILKLMIRQGWKDTAGHNIAMYAAMSDEDKILEFALIEGDDPLAKNNSGRSLFSFVNPQNERAKAFVKTYQDTAHHSKEEKEKRYGDTLNFETSQPQNEKVEESSIKEVHSRKVLGSLFKMIKEKVSSKSFSPEDDGEQKLNTDSESPKPTSAKKVSPAKTSSKSSK